MKKALALLLAACFLTGLAPFAMAQDVPDTNRFTWWITKTDGQGTFYQDYEENPVVQWINQQRWAPGGKGYTTDGSGQRLSFSFQVPIIGTESDNFTTMIATEEYPEVIDMAYSNQSPTQLYEDGVLMDITEYVEDYMPNYLALLEKTPEVKPLVTIKGDDGKPRYYSLYGISDALLDPFEGYMYRRDWVVRYASPTDYVWDWQSSQVTANGHPLYTPLAKAKEMNDFTGWKPNDVTSFSFTQGSDPNNDWQDNVIFPSGGPDPHTVSDWEWMLEAFQRALEAEGLTGNPSAYGLSVYYPGYMGAGDLVSSFGPGAPGFYKDSQGAAHFGGDGSTMRTYVECLNTWYSKGWVDTRFETRSSDMFYKINSTGYSQGMVGLWQGAIAMLGTTIRATAATANGKAEGMVFGCSLPINDVYGQDENKFVTPHTLYQQSFLGTPTGFTVKCEGKDLATLFSFIDWKYTRQGALITATGLTEELYKSIKLEPDLYAEYGLTSAFSLGENGLVLRAVPTSEDLSRAIAAGRMACGLGVMTNISNELTSVTQHALNNWKKYKNTGSLLDYLPLMNDQESAQAAKLQTYINDWMEQSIPDLIKNGLDGWDTYVKKLNKYGPQKLTKIYQDVLDRIK